MTSGTDASTERYLDENRRLWDAWTKVHVDSAFYDVDSFRSGANPIRVADYEIEEVGDVRGKSLLHLQCHFGLDTLSWARLGATVTGADFSSEGVAAATALANEVDLPATFIHSNLYDLPENLDGEAAFDVVYTSNGVLGWLPDIKRWARVVAHFLKPGGLFYITEIHPVAMAFENEGVQPGKLRLEYPYWNEVDPVSLEVKGSYADRDAATQGFMEHGWAHGLGEIVTALIEAGLRIESLREYPFCVWSLDFLVEGADGRYRLPDDAKGELPIFFSLRATKPAEGG
jgi:2-polyprenyl-3-methyl-5-hydroxy-6-metoxy-1,4-benzoquinol methylase